MARRGVAFAAVVVAITIGLLERTVAAQTGPLVIMSGLDNPRGMDVGPEGAIYVTEAGHGGSGPCQSILPNEPPRCFGLTGAVTRFWRGVQERVVSDLPSNGNAVGSAGPNDISLLGRGGAYVTIGSGGDPALRVNWGPGGEAMGTLLHVPASGRWRVVADIAAFEASANPDRGAIDSNAFGVLAEPSARLVTDAGGNSLLEVAANGDISVVAVFPSRASGRSTDSVPTEVVRGPDGALYVSELSGVPFAPGAANIYRVVPGSAPQVYLSGFTTVIDLQFGPDGRLYVLQHSSEAPFFGGPGQIIRVESNGSRTVVLSGLDRPTSLLVDEQGVIYVTNHGLSPTNGQVLRIEP